MKEEDRIAYERDIAAARKEWGDGPWSNEPDRIEWRHRGLPCLMVRSDVTGSWCGYVGIPNGHPLYGVDDLETLSELEVYRGINYAKKCGGVICHLPDPGESDDVFWIGFACAGPWDDMPMHHHAAFAAIPKVGLAVRVTYRDVAFVKREVERLAEQIADRGPTPPLARLIESDR